MISCSADSSRAKNNIGAFSSLQPGKLLVPLLTGHRESHTVMASVEVELLSARHSQRDHIYDITDIGCLFT